MTGPKNQYTRELYERFGYLATWTPGSSVRIGDVGVITDNVFTRLSSLESMGIPFAPRANAVEEDIFYTSESGVDITFKAAGAATTGDTSLVKDKVGVIIEFRNQAGVVFVANGCNTPSIEDQIGLGDEIIQRYTMGAWNSQHVVVTEVVQAQSATVFVSESSGGRVELIAEGSIELGMAGLADATTQLSMTLSRSMHTSVIARKGASPLLRVRYLRRRLLRRPTLGIRRVDPLNELPPNQVDPRSLDFPLYEPRFGEISGPEAR